MVTDSHELFENLEPLVGKFNTSFVTELLELFKMLFAEFFVFHLVVFVR
jgi:hypothetical protein